MLKEKPARTETSKYYIYVKNEPQLVCVATFKQKTGIGLLASSFREATKAMASVALCLGYRHFDLIEVSFTKTNGSASSETQS